MKAPTITRTEPVAHAGMLLRIGEKKSEMKNQKAVAIAVRPVRPPSEIPEADSTKGVHGEVPKKRPEIEIHAESTRKAAEDPSKSPSRTSKTLACLAMATVVPVVSRRST